MAVNVIYPNYIAVEKDFLELIAVEKAIWKCETIFTKLYLVLIKIELSSLGFRWYFILYILYWWDTL